MSEGWAGRLAPFFEARTVAIIGASRSPAKVGGSVLANLIAGGFSGRIVPVNRAASVVQGLPAVHSIADVPGRVDLAAVVVPSREVLPALQACADKKVGAAVVISAGFREVGGTGAAREVELRTWLASQRLRVLGPNCLGWIRPAQRLNLTFAPDMPREGRIAFVSHSGALAVALLDWARDLDLGFSLFASLGNQADVTESDVLDAAAADPETRVIAAYIEGVPDGARFLSALHAAAQQKPVVLLKAGRSAGGARAVMSHTGAIAGSDRAFDAAVRRAGAVRAQTVEELFDLARFFATQPLPRGRRVAIVTNGGGLGIVAADAATAAGLAVEPFGAEVDRRLDQALPATATVHNPLDLIGDADADRYGAALAGLTADAADALLVILTAQAATDAGAVARVIASGVQGWSIPVMASFVGGPHVAAGRAALESAGIPSYPFPERAVQALGRAAELAECRRRRACRRGVIPLRLTDPAQRQLRALGARGPGALGMPELASLLEATGIPTLPMRFAATPDEAAAAAAEIGVPVALKIASPDVSHKTDVGGVRLGLPSAAAVHSAVGAMLAEVRHKRPRARIEGVVVQKMAGEGHELLLGMVRDAQFGPLVVVGFGGVFVETVSDTSARPAPVDADDAREMLDELKMAPLLRGARGRSPVDRDALVAAIVAFGALAAEAGELSELEINPLVAGPDGVVAVDARAVWAPVAGCANRQARGAPVTSGSATEGNLPAGPAVPSS